MLRDRRLWLSLLAAAIVAVVYLYLRFERPLPAISGVNWYLLPFFVSIGLVVPVFGKDWESPLAMAFVTFAVGSVLIVTVATWLLQHAVMNPQLLAVIIQDFTDARAMSNERGGALAAAWVVLCYFAALLLLRHEERSDINATD